MIPSTRATADSYVRGDAPDVDASGADASAAGSLMVAQQDTPLPEGGSCSGDIARYRAIQEQDIKMGHVAKSVYNKIKAEIAAAEAECNSGHEAHARQMILVSKKKHGYPTDL